VSKIVVQLERCVQQQPTFYPVRLQRMHKEPHPFDLNPLDSAYIDLLALVKGAAEYNLVYEDPALPNTIAVQPLTLVVGISATDVPLFRTTFEASRDSSGRVHVLQM